MAAPLVGLPIFREEAAAKITGSIEYTADVRLPGTLQARAVRSPHAHARIVSIDATRALALPGVVACLTAADVPPRRAGRKLQDMTLIARDRVRFVGDLVALVAAEDVATAERAALLVDVEYELLPALFDPLAAMAPDAPAIHPDLATFKGLLGPPPAPNVYLREVLGRGDLAVGFAASDLVVAATYRTQPQHQCYMEPYSCQVAVDAGGRMTVYATNKAPFVLRDELAEFTGLPLEQIRVIASHIGGDFGGKGVIKAEPLCYYLALKTGRPVRFVTTRDEDFMTGHPRHGSVITVKAGVTRDGILQAWQAQVIFNGGAYAGQNARIIPGGANRATGPYRIPHTQIECLGVYTNVQNHGHMRAPGDPQAAFASECHMDTIARTLGMDPVALRLKNAVGRNDLSPLGRTWRDNRLQETIGLAMESYRQSGPPPQAPPGTVVGTGFGCCERYMGVGRGGAWVRLDADGCVTVVTGTVDVGTGHPTLLRQIAGTVLGLPMRRMRVYLGDTDHAPWDQGIGGSRHTPVSGNACRLAAEELIRQMSAVAEELLECPPELLEYEDGRFKVRGTPDGAFTIELAEIAQAVAESGRPQLMGKADVKLELPPETCFAAAVADVAVDLDTGRLQVLRVVGAHDVGKALNPNTLRSQLEGALLQGVGMATTERFLWNEKGQVTTCTFADYGLPTAADVPEIISVWLEGGASPGPFGAKSVAEIALVAVVPAVANAVAHATGCPATELPLNMERVLKMVRERAAVAGEAPLP